jgi:hypothetical protein
MAGARGAFLYHLPYLHVRIGTSIWPISIPIGESELYNQLLAGTTVKHSRQGSCMTSASSGGTLEGIRKAGGVLLVHNRSQRWVVRSNATAVRLRNIKYLICNQASPWIELLYTEHKVILVMMGCCICAIQDLKPTFRPLPRSDWKWAGTLVDPPQPCNVLQGLTLPDAPHRHDAVIGQFHFFRH